MRIASLVVMVALVGCGSSGGDDDDDPPGVFDPSVTEVRIEIDYESGNPPYTGAVVGFGDTFAVSQANLDRVFGGHKTVTIPTTTAAMEDIGAIDDEELTADDLRAIAAAHRQDRSAGNLHSYYVVFVSGLFTDGGGPNPNVLAVSIGSTGVIAMFKDVIAGTGGVVPNTERYVEQSTLVHELGHAIGLVANGVATTSAHHDTAHGAHCTNDRCVMYYLNEGASDMASFAQQFVTSGSSILFDDACLADLDALTGGP